MQNLSDLENKETIPNQNNSDSLVILIQKMQTDMNEIKEKLINH